jgi:hypothetical protein
MMLGRHAPVLAFLAGAAVVGCGLSTSGLQSGGQSTDAGVDVAGGQDSGSGGSDATNLPEAPGAVDSSLPGDDGPPPPGDDASDAATDDADDAPSTMQGCSGATPMWCDATNSCMADCTQCTGAPLSCRDTGTCVADCSTSCGSTLTISCFACDNAYQNPHGSCEANDPTGYCLAGLGSFNSGPYGGAGLSHHCDCPCLAPNQVCVAGINKCLACGEANTQGGRCTNNKTCDQNRATCH